VTTERFSPGMALDFCLLGISLAEISAIVAAIELLVTILKLRVPGMSLNRMPVFVWTILAISFVITLGFPPLVAGSALLELDRSINTQFFTTVEGGSALLWQHLFSTFGHPEVYIQFLPGAGIISMVVPVFTRRPIAGYLFVTLAIATTAMLSFGLWVHHMFTVGFPLMAQTFFTAASLTIAIPSGIQFFA
jgi:cytochrome c oxidase subunit I+III